MRRFLLLIVIFLLSIVNIHSQIISTNKLFALYYGWPSLVNGAGGDLTKAKAVWGKFKVVVFPDDIVDGDGDRYADNTHPDYANTSNIIVSLSNQTHFFGYVDLGVTTENNSTNQMKSMVDKWKSIGVYGIFWDDYGFDYNVTTERQTWAVNYAHSKGLKVIANAWDPDDVFWNGNVLEPGDGYCWENFLVVGGYRSYESPTYNQSLDKWQTKSDKCLSYKYSSQFNGDLMIYCLSTLSNDAVPSAFSNKSATNLADYAYWGFNLYGFDYFQFTDMNYSAGNNFLYIYRHPVILTQYVGDSYTTTSVETTGSPRQYKRYTDQGVIFFNASNNIQPTNMGWFQKDSSAPAGVSSVNIYADKDGIHIEWSNPSSDYYKTIVFKSNAGFVYDATNNRTNLIIYSGSSVSYLDTDITNGKTYYYTIYAIDKVYNYSVAYTNKFVYNDIWGPAAPDNFQLNYNGNGQATLVWKINSEFDFAGYNVYRKGLTDSSFSKINTSLITNNYFSDANLSSGKYSYYVKAVDTSGNEGTATRTLSIYVGDYNILKDKKVNVINNLVNLNETKNFKAYFLLDNKSNVSVKIFDLYGKLLKSMNSNFNSGLNSISINCEGLDSGIYVVKLESSEFNKTFKFAVVK